LGAFCGEETIQARLKPRSKQKFKQSPEEKVKKEIPKKCGDENQKLQNPRRVDRTGFMQRAIEHGLRFGKPWGEPKGYDFAVERGGKFVSVQVKSTMCRKPEGGYSCTLKDSKGKYRGNPFEFLAAYVIPDDTWFIVPGRKVRGMSNIALYPHSNRAKYTPYKEA
jgi:hypothetical protein